MRNCEGIINILLITLLMPFSLLANYTVSGRVNLNDQWQPKVFMAAVEKLSDYYRASPDLIINIAEVDENGYFQLEGDNLPGEDRFYRLYLMKKQNDEYDACLYVGGDDHNFVHIVLNNNSKLRINAGVEFGSPFVNYTFSGDMDNQLMRELAKIVYPSFYFYQIKFPTELKFTEAKLHTDLKAFVDTCRSPIVSLAAVNNTDFDEYFDRDKEFYMQFGERLKSEMPRSTYTKNFIRKLNYYANENEMIVPSWIYATMGLMSIIIISLAFWVFRLKKQLIQHRKEVDTEIEAVSLKAKQLTKKEKEILQLISQGKSNKEIATELYVELSTVKTHINKIYSKLNVKNRKEAVMIGINEVE